MKHITSIKIFNLIKKIFPFNRSLTGNGNRKTLNQIKLIIKKLKIIEYKSGKKVFDWKIPKEWNVKDAYIKYKGKKIVDFKKNNLHLVGYSQPIKRVINLKKLRKHLFTDKENKNVIPYVTSYYKKSWGFCVSHEFKKKLNGKKYEVFIDSSFNNNGSLTIGEMKVKGKSKKEILLSTNICHPSMANNEASGIAIVAFIAKFLTKRRNNFSYRILFLPETIGTISYLKNNLNEIKKFFFAGFHLTCLGGKKEFSMLSSKYENSYSDFAAKTILLKKKNKKIYSFKSAGSDERQYNYPGINLPVVTLTRELFGKFKEYHTSADNLKKININELSKSYEYVKNIILFVENNYEKIKKNNFINVTKLAKHQKKRIKQKGNKLNFNPKVSSVTKCEPFMSKRKLYRTTSKKYLTKNEKNLFQILYYSDGLRVSEISKYLDKKPNILFPIIKVLKKHKLIKFS